MNHQRNLSAGLLRRDGRRDALRRLDEALEKNSGFSNAEKIRLMRKAMFADVDALVQSGKIKIPK